MNEKPKRDRGSGSLFQRGPVWWISYSHRGRLYRESSRSRLKCTAKTLLKHRLNEIGNATFIGPVAERVRIDELWEDIERDYRINGRKSLADVQTRWRLHLKPFLGGFRACDISPTLIRRYIDHRLSEKAANATVNRETALLRVMFNHAREQTLKVSRVPYVPVLEENNVRTGFVEECQYRKLSDYFGQVGLWARAIFEVAYSYGWRRGEVLGLHVKQIDLIRRIIRLDTGTTKNKQGRIVTMTGQVFLLLQQCCEGKTDSDFVFTRLVNGQHKPVLDFREVWKSG